MSALPRPVPCFLCGQPLEVRLAEGRRSGKPFLMLRCPQDGRHFRGFITDQAYVQRVLALAEGRGAPPAGEGPP